MKIEMKIIVAIILLVGGIWLLVETGFWTSLIGGGMLGLFVSLVMTHRDNA